MKHVVSVSIGSSKRDHKVEIELMGERILIERRGTDGSLAQAGRMIQELDGKVDAIGLGGMDLYIFAVVAGTCCETPSAWLTSRKRLPWSMAAGSKIRLSDGSCATWWSDGRSPWPSARY